MTNTPENNEGENGLVVSKPENEEAPAIIDNQIMPVIPDEKWIAKYNEFLDNYDKFIDKQMKPDTDFGIIPGTQKPTLYLAGAQKLEKLFFLTSKTDLSDKTITEDYSFIKYAYRTSIYRGQILVATCEGTCNSKEKKYRFETVFDNQANEEQKKNGKLETRTSKAGKPYSVYVVEKKEFYDIENTIMKMAQKRAYVGAILTATNSSGRFTQDIEDMDLGNGRNKVIQQPVERVGTVKPASDIGKLFCSECGNPITKAEADYSEGKFNSRLCRGCQAKQFNHN